MTKQEYERLKEKISEIDNLGELTDKMVELINTESDYRDYLYLFIHRAYLMGISVIEIAKNDFDPKNKIELETDEQGNTHIKGDFSGCVFAMGNSNVTINNNYDD